MNVFKRLWAKIKGLFGKNRKIDQSTQSSQDDSTTDNAKFTDDSKPYHISQNNDKKSEYYKMWLVRREQSGKTLKHFETQQEAIEYAQALAETQETTIVVHGMDGTIRKIH